MPLPATPLTAALIRGAVELETTAAGIVPHRLPAWARAKGADAQLAMVEAQPSGVRLAFTTAATAIELDARPTKRRYRGMPASADGRYVLRVDGADVATGSIAVGNVLMIDMAAGGATLEQGEPGTLRFAGLPAGAKTVELYLPHNETTELMALRADAPVSPLADSRRRWLHHGSSISQGSNAAMPTQIWPVVAATRGNLDLTNLGFGGSALLDPFVARTIRDMPADLISLKLGINLVNTDLMRLRAFGPAVHGFIDTIREGHPATPLLIVSPICCPIHEDTPGPSAMDMEVAARGELRFRAAGDVAEIAGGKLTLRTIRTALAAIVAQRRAADPNLHYLDGHALYGPADAERLPLPDALHPDSAAHELIGTRFADLAFAAGGPLASA